MGLPLYPDEGGGARESDEAVLAGFSAGRSPGASKSFGIEGPVLNVHGDVAAAIRLSPDTVITRRDLPDDVAWAAAPVAEALSRAGHTLLDEETVLAVPVALQVVGIRLSSWDLWGRDLDDAFAALRTAAVGEEWNPLLSGGSGSLGAT